MTLYGKFPVGGGDSGVSVLASGGRVPWDLYDGSVSYQLMVNPDTATMPSIKRTVTARPTCSGRQVTYEGKPSIPEISFSGVILEEAQFRAFEEWVSLRKLVRITDDLGMKYWVYLKNFSPQRQKVTEYPWYHTYSVSGVLADWWQ